MPRSSDIVVVLPNWIGDVVMAIPTLRALRKRFPRPQRLVGVLRPYAAAVLENEPWLDEIVLHDRRGQRGGMRLGALIQRFRAQPPETMIVLASSLRFGLLAWLSGARQRIGYRRNFRGWTLTQSFPPLLRRADGSRVSVVEQYLQLAYALGCPDESPQPELTVTAADEAGAERVWTQLGFTSRTRVVALNPGGGNGTARNWDVERFAELARRVVDSAPDLGVLVLCGPAEKHVAQRIADDAGRPRVASMADQDMRLGVTTACVRRAAVVVTGDHGLRHIAAAVATPTVCLEGPIDGECNYSFNPYELRVSVPLDCRPCGKLECPLGHRQCMTQLSVEQVWQAVASQLAPRPLVQIA